MIDTNFRSGIGTTRSGLRTPQAFESTGDSFSRSGDGRGVFFGKPVEQVAPKDPKQPGRVSAGKLQSGLGISAEQAKTLTDTANVDFQEPYKAGRLDTGEVFLVTSQNYQLDPKGFSGYKDMFRIYVMDPQSGETRQLAVTSAERMRDGGSTYIGTEAGRFDFPVRGDARVCGRALTARLDSMQMS